MDEVVAIFLVAPLVVVPLGYRLLEVAAPGYAPPPVTRLGMVVAGALLALSFLFHPGLAALYTVPWLTLTGVTAVTAGVRLLRSPDLLRPGPAHAVVASLAFLATGAAFAFADRLGIQPFGFPADVITLTMVHFHFAGFALPLAGALAFTRRPHRWLEVATGAVIVGIPTTALGFFGFAAANWVGAVLTAVGGMGIGLATIGVSRSLRTGSATALAILAGASLLVSMPLAIAYATQTLVETAWLSVGLMAAVHGTLNAFGFSLPATIAWTLERRAITPAVVGVSATTGQGPARAVDVIAFNALPFVAGPVAIVIALLVAASPTPMAVRAAATVAAIVGAVACTAAVVAILWVFEWSADRRWEWVGEVAGRHVRWLNVTTGFDDSTDRVRTEIGPEGQSIDLFDDTIEHEAALGRARRRFPPAVEPVTDLVIGPLASADSIGTVLLLMSAHELPPARRQATFEVAARALEPGGRVVLVEHLRDVPNMLAFGRGAWHFESRATWLATAASAGLRVVDETRLSPFVRGFVFEAAR